MWTRTHGGGLHTCTVPVLYLYSTCTLPVQLPACASIRNDVNIRSERSRFLSLHVYRHRCWLRVSTLSVSSQLKLGGYLCVCMWL